MLPAFLIPDDQRGDLSVADPIIGSSWDSPTRDIMANLVAINAKFELMCGQDHQPDYSIAVRTLRLWATEAPNPLVRAAAQELLDDFLKAQGLSYDVPKSTPQVKP